MRKQLASLLGLLVTTAVVVSAEAWTSTPKRQATRMSVDSKPPPNKLSAIYRSVQSEDDHMIVKVVYDPKQLEAISTNGMPVVLFLNGANCPHESYMWLASRLAHDGYCLVLSSCVASFGPATGLLSVPFNLEMLHTIQGYKEGPSNQGISAILDTLQALVKDESTPLLGKLDLNRLVVGGHSSGGRTVLDLVAYDSPFPIVAAFVYGASLVVTSDGLGFAPKGTVVPCDASEPPPLLLLGGSEDGICAMSSDSGDATETLVRTMKQGLEQANGNVDLLILEGANHMVFCSPIDPTCGANPMDRPLQVNGDKVRKVLGDVICDFLKNKGLADRTKPGDFRPNVPSSMVHTTTSFRPRGSSTPIMSLVDSEQERREEVWTLLSSALDNWVSEIASELGLEPTERLPDDARQWTAGTLTGTLQAWESPLVVWAVRYGNSLDGGPFAKSVGFNVWLSSGTSVPHLTVYVGVRGNRATLMADHLPRVNLGMNAPYLEQYYGGDRGSAWSRLQKLDTVESFSSSDPTIRAVQGPNALALSCEIDSLKGIDELMNALNDHCKSWIEFVNNSPRLSAADSKAVAERDLGLRQILCSHERAAGERFMDKALANTLANNMAGFTDI